MSEEKRNEKIERIMVMKDMVWGLGERVDWGEDGWIIEK